MKSKDRRMRSVANKSQAKLFGGSKNWRLGRLPHTPFLPVGRSGGPCPTFDRSQGRRSGELVRPKSSPKANEALCVNRVPWASNNTTLPTALATRLSTLSYADTIPRSSQISQGTRKLPGLVVLGPRRSARMAVRRRQLAARPRPKDPDHRRVLALTPSSDLFHHG